MALTNLADTLCRQEKYSEAEPLLQRAVQTWEEHFGSEDAHLAYPLSGLAELYRLQARYSESLPLYKRALRLRKKAFGLQHPETAEIMDGLGQLREAQRRYGQARLWYARVRAIREEVLGSGHPATIETYHRSIALLRKMGRHDDEAAELEARLQATQNSNVMQEEREVIAES